MCVERDDYTGYVRGVNAPEPVFTPEQEDRIRDLIREVLAEQTATHTSGISAYVIPTRNLHSPL